MKKSTRPVDLALPHSCWQTALKSKCWVCGTNRSIFEQKGFQWKPGGTNRVLKSGCFGGLANPCYKFCVRLVCARATRLDHAFRCVSHDCKRGIRAEAKRGSRVPVPEVQQPGSKLAHLLWKGLAMSREIPRAFRRMSAAASVSSSSFSSSSCSGQE